MKRRIVISLILFLSIVALTSANVYAAAAANTFKGSSRESVGQLMSFEQYSMASNNEERAFKVIKKSV